MTKLLPLRRPPSLLTPTLRPSAQPHSTRRSSSTPSSCSLLPTTQRRHATYIARKRHPYFFTQMVQLSDGSTYTVRTTSPHALHRSSKDTRNHTLWQPTEKSLQNVEEDEAGKLAAFRERFGRSFDMASAAAPLAEEGADGAEVDAGPAARGKGAAAPAAAAASAAATEAKKSKVVEAPAAAVEVEEEEDTLGDLLASYAAKAGVVTKTGATAKEQAKQDRKKGKK